MAKRDEISATVIKRLPRYYRFIGELIRQGTVRISSSDLAERMSLTASQIRQDLNCFGGFGQQGYGYNLPELHAHIGKILGVDEHRKAVLIGAGNLGKAIAMHMDFAGHGMELCGIFDSAPDKIGTKVGGMTISSVDSLEDFLHEHSPIIAILCIPKAAAEELALMLVQNGVKAFWNFSHYDFGNISTKYNDIVIENVHLGDSLMLISYGLTNN